MGFQRLETGNALQAGREAGQTQNATMSEAAMYSKFTKILVQCHQHP